MTRLTRRCTGPAAMAAEFPRHRIHSYRDGSRWVRTLFRIGVYAVHSGLVAVASASGLERRRMMFTVDHVPSGFGLGPPHSTLLGAIRACETWHREAFDACKGAALGEDVENDPALRRAAAIVRFGSAR